MKIVHTNDAPQAIGPYSQGMSADGWFFSSGQIPLDAAGNLVEGGIEAQTAQVFANLRAVLKAANSSLDRVVKATVFVKDLGHFAALNAVYAQEFGTHKPARSTVEVARLPRDVLIEIEVVARCN